jgi:hypothetical protein
LRNIHEAAVNVTAPMTASGHNSGSNVPNPAPSQDQHGRHYDAEGDAARVAN